MSVFVKVGDRVRFKKDQDFYTDNHTIQVVHADFVAEVVMPPNEQTEFVQGELTPVLINGKIIYVFDPSGETIERVSGGSPVPVTETPAVQQDLLGESSGKEDA